MSKAEERAEEYCKSTLVGSPYVKKMAYLKGYHQAEKDLALTWEDLEKLWELMSTKRINDGLFDKEDYEEVLKRFKEKKGEEA